jgi:hypothetical protein
VSAEPSQKAKPLDILFQSVWFRLIYLLFLAIYITVLWFVLGPASKVAGATTPWYVVRVACGTFGLVVAVPGPAVMRRMPRQWFRVPARERLLHRMLGVGVFGWLLDVSGWNRHVLEPLRGFSGKRAGLPPSNSRCEPLLSRTESALPSTYSWPSSHFSAGSVERGTVDAVAGCSRSSLPGAATALHHASTPAAAG